MASKKSVLICDDDQNVATEWAKRLNETLNEVCKGFAAENVAPGDFAQCVRGLSLRRKSARTDEPAEKNGSEEEKAVQRLFDRACVLVIDYELLDLGSDFGPMSGEEIAYLARMYSTCGIIVVLNEPPDGTERFDLTFRGYSDKFADLHVSDRLLCFPGLWSDAHLEAYRFRPWHWPNIPVAVEKYERRVAELKGKLGTSIAEYFPKIAKAWDFLPLAVQSFISESNGASSTFNDFLDNSPNAKRFPKDKYRDEHGRCRVAAARVHHFLERLVLPLQEVLTDAPHLAMRYPSLVKKTKNSDGVAAYDRTAALDFDQKTPEGDWTSPQGEKLLEKYRFGRSDWLTRPAWLGIEMKNDDVDLPEIRDPLNAEAAPVVFCEDISRFMDPKYTQGVVADLASANRMRYVVRKEALKGAVFRGLQNDLELPIEYEPRMRLAY